MFGDNQIDRRATGSGATARMAVDAARGLIAPGASRGFAGASVVPFHAELLAQERLGPHPLARPQAPRRSAAPRPG